jgi:hypothetical protein
MNCWGAYRDWLRLSKIWNDLRKKIGRRSEYALDLGMEMCIILLLLLIIITIDVVVNGLLLSICLYRVFHF